MSETETSRRVFVGGLAVAATVAGSMALLRGGSGVGGTAQPGGITVLGRDGKLPELGTAGVPQPWLETVGKTVGIDVGNGVVDARIATIVPGPDKGKRPAHLRQHSFTVYFELDRLAAPAGERIYGLGRAIDGMSELFMTRGKDVAGKAILMAVLN